MSSSADFSDEEDFSQRSGTVSPAPGDTLPWNLPKHERSKRKIQGGSVLDPAERAVLRIAGKARAGAAGGQRDPRPFSFRARPPRAVTKLFGRLLRLGELMRVEGEPKHAQVRPLNFHAKRHQRPGAAAAAGGSSAGPALFSAHKAEAAPGRPGGSGAGAAAARGEARRR